MPRWTRWGEKWARASAIPTKALFVNISLDEGCCVYVLEVAARYGDMAVAPTSKVHSSIGVRAE